MNFNNIPEEMRAMPNWSCYKTYTDKEGKRKKILISPKDGKFAKSNLPETWADLDTANAPVCVIDTRGLPLRWRAE